MQSFSKTKKINQKNFIFTRNFAYFTILKGRFSFYKLARNEMANKNIYALCLKIEIFLIV